MSGSSGADYACWRGGPDGFLASAIGGATPSGLGDVSDASDASVGFAHKCAARSTGNVVCWGAGGLLGDGTTTDRSAPVTVVLKR